ncbi:MAG TPA: hypothetical protein VKA98_02050 [Nitrososphaeraceae archaeon]|nr:hypothetical protein [Nitrososphaeraceae archaeon]
MTDLGIDDECGIEIGELQEPTVVSIAHYMSILLQDFEILFD